MGRSEETIIILVCGGVLKWGMHIRTDNIDIKQEESNLTDQFLTDYLSSIFGKEILVSIIISGYLILLSYFYGTDKWNKKISDFDKFAFAIMIGLTIYYFFAIPMAHFFIFLSAPDGYFTVDSDSLNRIIFFILLSILIVGVTRIQLNEPLFSNKGAFSIFFKAFPVFLIILSFIDFFLRLFLSGVYSDCAPHHSSQLTNNCINPMYILISIIMLLLLFSILHGRKPTKCIIERLNQLCNSKVKCTVIIIVIIVLVLSKPIGTRFSPSIEEGEISINSYTLEPFYVDMTNKNFKGQAEVEKSYNISTKLNGWIPIEVNGIVITEVVDKINNSKKYFSNESYFIVDEHGYMDVSLVVKGTQDVNLSSTEFKYIYTERGNDFEKEIEIRNLTLINNKPCKINIDHIDIRKNINYGMSLDDFLELQRLASDKNGSIGGYNENEGRNVFILNDLTLDKKSNITFQLNFSKTR